MNSSNNIFENLIKLRQKRDNKIVGNILLAKMGLREDIWLDFERQRQICRKSLKDFREDNKGGNNILEINIDSINVNAKVFKFDLEIMACELADSIRNLPENWDIIVLSKAQKRRSLNELDLCLLKMCVNMKKIIAKLEALEIEREVWKDFVCDFCEYYINYLSRRLYRQENYDFDYLKLSEIYKKMLKVIDKIGELE